MLNIESVNHIGIRIKDKTRSVAFYELLGFEFSADAGYDESLRMVELLRNRFQLMPGEALNMIARASNEFAAHTELDGIMVTVNDNLAPAQKEDLILMVLSVISADNQKDAAEMNLLAALIEGLKIPDKVMNKVYQRYFENQ